MSLVAETIIIVPPEEAREKSRVVTFKASPSEVEAMNRAARLLGLSRSELIRLAVSLFIREHVLEE